MPKIKCKIIEKIQSNAESNIHITIFQGLPKVDKMELIIEKCVELGADEITPVEMKRCVARLDEKTEAKKRDRWQKIAETAAKQSGRDIIPKVNQLINVKNICNLIDSYDIVLLAYEEEKENTLKDELKHVVEGDILGNLGRTGGQPLHVGIIIGPEGGLEPVEVSILKESGAKVVTLGNRILRTETVRNYDDINYNVRLGGSYSMSRIIDKRQENAELELDADIDIEEEIEKQYKLLPENKKQIIKKVIMNYLMAILIMAYFLLLIIGNRMLSKDIFVLGSKIADFVLLIITVVILEIAYKKDSGRITIFGIELLAISIFSLFIPYAFYELSENIKKYFMMAGLVMAVYYIIKSVIVYKLEKRKYIKSLSDIGDIIKKGDKKTDTAVNFVSLNEDADVEKKETKKKLEKVKNEEPKRKHESKQETEKKSEKDVKKKIEEKPVGMASGRQQKKAQAAKETKKKTQDVKRARHMRIEEDVKKSGRHMRPAEKNVGVARSAKQIENETVQIVQKPDVKMKKEESAKNDDDNPQRKLERIERELKEKQLEVKREKDLIEKMDKAKKVEIKKKEEAPQYIVQKRGRGRPRKNP